jgi:DNA-binding PadR family transcriptional regulator
MDFAARFGGCWSDFVTHPYGHRPRWGAWASFGPLGGRRTFFESGEVRLAILSLLADGPTHGYELIKQLEARSGGLYRASAGTVYRRASEDEGPHLRRQDKKRHRLTKEGRASSRRRRIQLRHLGRAERWEEWSQIGPEILLATAARGAAGVGAQGFPCVGDSPRRGEVGDPSALAGADAILKGRAGRG